MNEEAMVMELEYGKFKGLFTGDIGMETEKKLQSAHRLEDVDFLKVAQSWFAVFYRRRISECSKTRAGSNFLFRL